MATVGGQHSAERVRGGKGHVRETAMGGSRFQGQGVFQFMRGLAQFAKAAGRSVAFESMDDATYAAHEFDIARKPLQLERFIIQ